MPMIHPTALIDVSVDVPNDTVVGAFCVIERGVRLGHRVNIGAHAVLKSGTVLGDEVRIHAGVVLGDDPQIIGQAFNFESSVFIGDRSHVGHDAVVGNGCILANLALVAGCVTVENHAFLSGGSMIHQFVCIGESAFVSGNAEITMHIPPFVTVLDRNIVSNLNLVGLRRRGFSSDEIIDIKQQYRSVYGGNSLSFQKKALSALETKAFKTDRGRQFLTFFSNQTYDRGFVYPRNE